MTDVDAHVPTVLPRGPHHLGRDVVAASQRTRLLSAMAHAVAEKGYPAVSVADVVARAGVSRKTFYVHFADKLDCFLAAYDLGVEVLLRTMAEAGAEERDPRALVRARVRAYLATLAAEPAFARTFLIEINAAGPRALARRAEVHAQFAAHARELAPDVPEELPLAAVGATNELVSSRVAAGRVAELPELEDLVVHVQLAVIGSAAEGLAG